MTCFHSSRSFMLTQKQKVNYISYHRYYSPVSSGGPRAIEKGTYDTNEFEAMRTRD
jgi:hypothetical protein